jgi:hypothetical protein
MEVSITKCEENVGQACCCLAHMPEAMEKFRWTLKGEKLGEKEEEAEREQSG